MKAITLCFCRPGLWWLLVFFFCGALLVRPAWADPTGGAIEVEGYASIVAGRKDQAREAALRDAFRRAVEQVVGVAVESKTVVKDAELLNDRIFSRSQGFIKTYRILGERVEGDAYRMTVFASVSRQKLEQGLDDAGLLIRKLGKPRVAVVILEKNPEGVPTPGGIVETYLLDTLKKRGYALVDRQVMLAVEHAAASGAYDQTDAVVRAAAAGGADVVIMGRAEATAAPALNGTNLRPVQVSITGRAVEVDTAELLATVSASQRALHVNQSAAAAEAFHKAAVELTETLHQQMMKAWSKRLTGLRTLRVTVSNLPYTEIKHVQNALKEQLGRVEEVHDRGYRDQQLRLDLEVSGPFKELAGELVNLELGQSSLRVTGYSVGQLQLKWQPRAAQGGRAK